MKDIRSVAPAATDVNTGVEAPAKVAEKLSDILTATYDLLIRTHEVHWNIEGPMFYGVHMLTEAQYGELFAATDELAERIRALGQLAPTSTGALVGGAKTGTKASSGAAAMVKALQEGHEALARLCHECFELAEDSRDPVTSDLVTARSAAHEKAAWMLRSMAAG
ncbi:MAG: DNA starvation/stationary phase protection protein [Rhodobacteraceae bacterium]|nr:DNA starvation/stationary phase protection protein [Cephaloticoccus sp.]MCB1391102.1 DNA starvation/stationary phase protection protein [Paracoccaceae bacterium]